jgi:calcium-binding protein CML
VSAMAASTAELRKAFDKMDHDGSGELDRDELMQLMQIMEPRRGITNDELDAAMKEIDTGGDGLVDFNEFSTYYQNHMSDDGCAPCRLCSAVLPRLCRPT